MRIDEAIVEQRKNGTSIRDATSNSFLIMQEVRKLSKEIKKLQLTATRCKK